MVMPSPRWFRFKLRFACATSFGWNNSLFSLAKAVGEQIGESDEGFPARGGVREAVVEAGVED